MDFKQYHLEELQNMVDKGQNSEDLDVIRSEEMKRKLKKKHEKGIVESEINEIGAELNIDEIEFILANNVIPDLE